MKINKISSRLRVQITRSFEENISSLVTRSKHGDIDFSTDQHFKAWFNVDVIHKIIPIINEENKVWRVYSGMTIL